jgi:ABC-type multidrug transport system ATPase subunit
MERISVNGKPVELDRLPLTVGRGEAVDVHLRDDRVSRRHAVLELDGDELVLRDAGSRNGIFFDGERVDEVRIAGSVRVRLGDRDDGPELEIAVGDAPPEEAPARAAPERPPPPSEPEPARDRKERPTTVRIGRGAENELRLGDDLLVSRYHAELRGLPDGGAELVDLGSHNGTYVNGEQIQSRRLEDADVVSVGTHLFRFVEGRLEEYAREESDSFRALDLTVLIDGDRKILDDVSLYLEPSSCLAVVGPSGSGKSTLLNALTAFRPADVGDVFYGDRSLYDSYDELRFRMGFVPQEDILHPQLTVRRALEFAAELRFTPDVDEDERRRRVDEVIAELGLSERADVRIEKLSGGQRKRVSVGLELLTKPSFLFLDEPTSGLDPGNERELMELLQALSRGGRIVIVVTHSTQSLDLCDRVIFLAPGGRMAYFGPPAQALEYFERRIAERNYAALFTLLDQTSDMDWKGAFEKDARYERYVDKPVGEAASKARAAVLKQAAPARVRHSWARQLSVLTRRNLALIASDRRTVALLVLQAPVLGFLFSLVARGPAGGVFTTEEGAQGGILIWLLVVGAVWLGISNSIREIVKEFPIYRRERAVGLGIGPYLTSKALVLGAITLVQAIVLLAIGVAGQEIPPLDDVQLLPYLDADPEAFGRGAALSFAWVELVIAVVLTAFSALAFGLLVSTLVRSSDQALVLLPILLAIQIVVSIPDPSAKDPPLKQIGYVTSAAWGVNAVGSTLSLNELRATTEFLVRYSDRVVGPEGLPGLEDRLVALAANPAERELREQEFQDTLARAAAGDPRWKHSGSVWAGNVLALIAIAAVCLAGAAVALRRRDVRLLGAGPARAAPAAPPER